MEKICSKLFSDVSNSSDSEEEIIKQTNTLKPFHMETRKAVPKKHFVSKEGNNCEEKINLTPYDRIDNIVHLANQLLWATSQLLVTHVILICLVDEFFFLFLV